MTRLYPSILTAALFALVFGAAHAEKADRFKPLNAEADAMRHDELKQQTLFTGNVIINKGSMVLRGPAMATSGPPYRQRLASWLCGAASATGSTNMSRPRPSSLNTTAVPTPCK
jgi:lipopolysaccharide export system protein LptA